MASFKKIKCQYIYQTYIMEGLDLQNDGQVEIFKMRKADDEWHIQIIVHKDWMSDTEMDKLIEKSIDAVSERRIYGLDVTEVAVRYDEEIAGEEIAVSARVFDGNRIGKDIELNAHGYETLEAAMEAAEKIYRRA